MNSSDLARAAQAVQKSTRPYTPMEPYIPAVDILRRKGWSWAAIHTWLLAHGQHVQTSPSTFGACMGRRYRNWLSRGTTRRSGKVKDASVPTEGNTAIPPGNILQAEAPAPPNRHRPKPNPTSEAGMARIATTKPGRVHKHPARAFLPDKDQPARLLQRLNRVRARRHHTRLNTENCTIENSPALHRHTRRRGNLRGL